MDELGRIRTFIKVVEAGSFSAVARHESSVSSVARQIKSLEDELGVRLLNRNTRSLSLTEPGKMFYDRVCTISNDLSNASSEVSSFQESVKGLLRVSLRISAGVEVIVPALPTLLKQYPELSIEVDLTDERHDLVADNIDVAVWLGNPPNAEIIAKRLTPSQRVVCGSPAYFQQLGTPKVPTDLTQHNCLLFNAPTHADGWTFEKDNQQENIVVNGNLRSDNGIVLLSAAMADLGIIVVHEWMVRRHISEGRLIKVLSDYVVKPAAMEADLFAIYPSRRGLPLKVRAFIDFLIDLFNEHRTAHPTGLEQEPPEQSNPRGLTVL